MEIYTTGEKKKETEKRLKHIKIGVIAPKRGHIRLQNLHCVSADVLCRIACWQLNEKFTYSTHIQIIVTYCCILFVS